jgi:DNA polymerase I
LRNFPMQANGAEMLRLACCLATERGVQICAPVHDAILIEAPLGKLEEATELARAAMNEASRVVLAGFELRTETKLIRYPDRYEDERGKSMWQMVSGILEQLRHRLGAEDDCGPTILEQQILPASLTGFYPESTDQEDEDE